MIDKKLKAMDIALKEHFISFSLSENQLDDLLMMQIDAEQTNAYVDIDSETLIQNPKNTDLTSNDNTKTESKLAWLHRFLPNSRNYRNAFYVTAFLFLACLFTFFSLLDREPLSQRIMSEIVYNHNQDMPIEIASSSLTEISEYLNKLSFSMVMPNALSESNWQLLGGRYCSINGKLAAQLKVRNLKDNSISTFYQAAIDKDLDKSNSNLISDTIDGVGVSIWQEHGLLLGLAREKRSFVK